MQHAQTFKIPPKEQSAVYHYHFHYIIGQNQDKKNLLRKVASDEALTNNKPKYQDSDNQSIYSQQSWKKLINPAFQTEQSHRVRSFKSSSHAPKAPEFANLQLSQLKLGQKNGYMTPRTVTKRDRATTNTSIPDRQLEETQDLRENSFAGQSDQLFPKINPEIVQKSKHSKRVSFSVLQENKQAFQTQSTKYTTRQTNFARKKSQEQEIPSEYAYSLLKQQCKYLRKTFLKHYIKTHLLKEQISK